MKLLSERVAFFLASKEGERVVNRYLRVRELRVEIADDVVQGAVIRAIKKERMDPDFEPDNLEAWTSVLVEREAKDVLRGRTRLRNHEEPVPGKSDDDVDFWDRPADEALALDEMVEFETVDLPSSAENVASIRRRLAKVLGPKPHQAAAAMCLVTITCDRAEPAQDCPRPRGGVNQDQAPWWAAVFYSGKTDCFASDGAEEDNAMRVRRSRALRQTKSILEEAANG